MSAKQSDPVRAIADASRAVRSADLLAFSDAPSELVREIRLAWPEIPLDRRRAVVRRMVDIAEDNVEADFRTVLKVFLQDPDGEVRTAAIEGLWEDRSPSFIDILSGLVEADPDRRVRAAAAGALRPFAEQAVLGKLPDARAAAVKTVLMRVFRKPGEDQEVRLAALVSVAAWDDDEVRAIIRETYACTDAETRAAAIAAMGVNLDAGWERFVLVELSSEHPEVRYEAAKAAGEMELASAVSDLIELVKDADSEVRLAAVSALGGIGGVEARRALRELVSCDDVALSEAAEEALEWLQFNADPLATSGGGLDVQALSKGKARPGTR